MSEMAPHTEIPGAPTREEWLQRAVQLLRPDFVRAGAPVPEALHVSIGFPSTRALGRRIGECWVRIPVKGDHPFRPQGDR